MDPVPTQPVTPLSGATRATPAPFRTALVTGASRGLGRALALALAEAGTEVVLVARGEADLARAVEDVRARGGRAHGVVADLGAPDSAAAILGQAEAALRTGRGGLDLLVHNASTLGPTPLQPLAELRPEAFDRVFQVNTAGPWRLTRAVVGGMVLRGRGTVLHVSSDAAVAAYPTWGAYGASKAAQDHLSRVWAAELEGTGVRVLSVDPGEMDTAMHAAALPEADPATLARPDAVARRILAWLGDPASAPSGARLTPASPLPAAGEAA